MFKMTVQLFKDSKGVEVTWEDGKLSGDESVVAMVESWLRVYGKHGATIGLPGGPSFREKYLETANGAVALLYEVCAEVINFDGEIEPWAPLPDGAVA